ncbi:MAG: tRNA dihydrouridine synthase DusB [Planctomycetota bacterium]|jgi:nifR3 family TIM-barrel protein
MRIGHLQPETNLLLAPIAGYCDLSFRLVVRSLGGLGLGFTDLLSPQGLLRPTKRSLQLVATCPQDQPLGMQLFGSDPDLMAEGASWAQAHGAAVVDINMGCPADKVVKRDGGVALMADPARATCIAAAVVRAVTIPVTVKMRLGCTDADLVAPRLARMCEDVGVQAITVHGRTGAQRFRGRVSHEGIAAVVQAMDRIPVVGNGDVKSPADARQMIDRTGCAGVMIGRRALSDPWIFRDTHAYLTTGTIPAPPTVQQRVAAIVRHFDNLRRFNGERAAYVEFRQRITWYARMLPQAKQLKRRMNRMGSADEFQEIIGEYLDRSPDQSAGDGVTSDAA